MKFNSTTHWISVLTMALYMLYILSALGFVGLIMSLAIALIIAAFVNSFEIVTASVVVAGVAYVILSRWLGLRSACKSAEGFSIGTPSEVLGVVDTMTKRNYGPDRTVIPKAWNAGPTGVLSKTVEGFADAGTPGADKSENKPGAQGQSEPEPVAPKKDPKKDLEETAKAVTTAINGSAAANLMKQEEEKKSDGFSNKEPIGLFKLGEMPSESKEGPHVDVGSTLMKAMGALQPDQIKSMTSDTQALLQTQQNLMGMLQSMQPILKDGRKLLDTFSGIFGNDSGLGAASGQFKIGN